MVPRPLMYLHSTSLLLSLPISEAHSGCRLLLVVAAIRGIVVQDWTGSLLARFPIPTVCGEISYTTPALLRHQKQAASTKFVEEKRQLYAGNYVL